MNVLMICNPRAGFPDRGVYEYLRALGSKGASVTVRFLNEGIEVASFLGDAPAYDVVVAAGGDGTVSSVAYALRSTGVPVLAYPAGTANLIARNLRLPTDAEALADATVHGVVAHLDLGELDVIGPTGELVRRVGFCVAAGAGFDAAVMEAAARLKTAIGEGAYVIGALQNLAPRVARFTIEIDGELHRTEGIAVLIVNLARIQFDLAMAHDSSAQDGVFEVITIRTKTAAGLLPAVWAALLDRVQDHPQRPGLVIHSARHVRVTTEPPLALQYDGETLPATTPIETRVLPGAGSFVVTSDSPYAPRSAEADA